MEKHVPYKIHIIGSVGSGKTTLARILSSKLQIPYYELDNVVWKRYASGDIRRSKEERDAYLSTIINLNEWIVEEVHHKWVAPSLQRADVIIFFRRMFRWNAHFEKESKPEIVHMVNQYKDRLIILKDNTEIDSYLHNWNRL